MTKPNVVDLGVDRVLISIRLEELRPSPWNARKTLEPKALEELVESVKRNGVITPLIVRSLDSTEDIVKNPALAAKSRRAYEIVAGWRRFNAAQLAGKKDVDCFVCQLTDDQARTLGLVDNLQREGVPPLEEADAYAELQQRLGSTAAIAAEVKKEVSYVARRLQLISLAEMPRRALAERLITIDHALLLARLGEAEQNVNLKWALNPNSGIKEPVEETIKQRIQERDRENRWAPWEPQSALSLKHHIEEHVGRKLARAPWDLDAKIASLPDVPACDFCPSNTKHNDTLFGDLNIDDATCEDGGCFERKRAAFVQIKLSAATEKQGGAGLGPAIRLSWKETTVKPRFSEAKAGLIVVDESGVNLMQVFKVGQWVEAKPKSCAFVRQGVTIDWSDDANRGFMGNDRKLRKPGEQLSVCIAPGCKAHRKEWEKPKSENRNAPHDSKAEEEKREKMRLAAIAESKIRVAVASAAIEKIAKLPAEALRALVLAAAFHRHERRELEAIVPGFEKKLKTAKVDSAEFAKAAALMSIEQLTAWQYSAAQDGRASFQASVKRLGYADPEKAWKELTKAETPAQRNGRKGGHATQAKKAAKKKVRK